MQPFYWRWRPLRRDENGKRGKTMKPWNLSERAGGNILLSNDQLLVNCGDQKT